MNPFEEFFAYISGWFANNDIHGVQSPFVQLIQSVIEGISSWFGKNA